MRENSKKKSFDTYINQIGECCYYNSFSLIYQYIKREILPKHSILVDCYMFDDEDDRNIKEFYLKFDGDLSYNEKKELHIKILKDIYNYCHDSGFSDEFKNISLFLNKVMP